MIEHKSSGRNLRRLLGDQPCPKTTRESDLLSLLAEAGPPESEVGFWSEAHVKTPYNLQCILNDFNLSPTPFDKEPKKIHVNVNMYFKSDPDGTRTRDLQRDRLAF